MAALSVGRVHEVVRLEAVAEQAAVAPGDYAAAFDDILWRQTRNALATKTILAYRGGFLGDLSDPSAAEVTDAAGRWRDDGGTRLTDRVLLRFGLHRALRLGKPLQFHVGFGDRDCDLHAANPVHLLDFLRVSGDTPVMLLHCYPYEREAGYLAQAFNNVYLDGGLAINYLGARSAAFIGRLLEMAPFRKILYSSDGFGPAELHYLGARLWRAGMAATLQRFVDADEWSQTDAVRVVGPDRARKCRARLRTRLVGGRRLTPGRSRRRSMTCRRWRSPPATSVARGRPAPPYPSSPSTA